MQLRLLHTKDCHAWQKAEKVLEEALIEVGLPVEYQVVLVTTAGQAEQLHFLGSPQITIDEVDVDPLAKEAKSFSVKSCRPYIYQGKSYDFPPKELIVEAIRR